VRFKARNMCQPCQIKHRKISHFLNIWKISVLAIPVKALLWIWHWRESVFVEHFRLKMILIIAWKTEQKLERKKILFNSSLWTCNLCSKSRNSIISFLFTSLWIFIIQNERFNFFNNDAICSIKCSLTVETLKILI